MILTRRLSSGLLKKVLHCFFFSSFALFSLTLVLHPPTASAQTGTFIATGTMTTPRFQHTVTLLANGQVLVAGGVLHMPGSGALASAEIYNPSTGTFSATGSMATPRLDHTATLLPNGQVLVAGGSNPAVSAELFNPATGSFSLTGSMITPRGAHAAILLPNGTVLIAGGSGNTGALARAEIYDPAAGTFSATGSMITARSKHTAALLPDGQVLVAGGIGNICCGNLASAELYNPATSTFSATASMITPRIFVFPAALLLGTGKVLIAGGAYEGATANAELYGSVPASADQCKNNGWTTLFFPDGSPFKNQGNCIQFVNTGK